MSGYLQRLATSATASPIHPVVGPMFSNAAPRPLADEAYHTMPSNEAGPDRHSETSTSPHFATGMKPLREEVSPVPLATTPIELRAQPPLEPPPDKPDVSAASYRTAATPARAVVQPHSHEQFAEQVRDLGLRETPRCSVEHTFVPLLEPIADTQRRFTPKQDGRLPATRHAPSALERGTPNTRSHGRTPDEVQIHIGRIEVTAIQPPSVPSQAAKPRRGGIVLADYLKQRNGRAP